MPWQFEQLDYEHFMFITHPTVIEKFEPLIASRRPFGGLSYLEYTLSAE